MHPLSVTLGKLHRTRKLSTDLSVCSVKSRRSDSPHRHLPYQTGTDGMPRRQLAPGCEPLTLRDRHSFTESRPIAPAGILAEDRREMRGVTNSESLTARRSAIAQLRRLRLAGPGAFISLLHHRNSRATAGFAGPCSGFTSINRRTISSGVMPSASALKFSTSRCRSTGAATARISSALANGRP